MNTFRHPEPHLDADQLNAFVSGALSDEARRQSLAHLAQCSECRRIVFLAQAAVEPSAAPTPAVRPTPRPWRHWLPLWALAGATVAALLALVLWLRPHPVTRPAETQVAVARPPVPPPLPPASANSAPAHLPAAAKPLQNRPAEESPARQHGAAPPANRLQEPAAEGVIGGLISSEKKAARIQPPAPEPSQATMKAAPLSSADKDLRANLAMAAPQPERAKAAPAQQPQAAPATALLQNRQQALAFGANVHALDLKIEPNNGPNDGSSELRGTVTDASGAVVAGARIALQRSPDAGSSAVATTDKQGQFTLPRLAPGQYAIKISASGFQTESRTVTLHARDLALLSPMLQVGASSQTVQVYVAANEPATTGVPTEMNIAGAITALPSGLPATAAVVKNGRTLAVDQAGSLFLSRNAGKRWKKIKAVWPGPVTGLALAPEASSTEQVLRKNLPVFQITTATGAVWVSSDGSRWRPR